MTTSSDIVASYLLGTGIGICLIALGIVMYLVIVWLKDTISDFIFWTIVGFQNRNIDISIDLSGGEIVLKERSMRGKLLELKDFDKLWNVTTN